MPLLKSLAKWEHFRRKCGLLSIHKRTFSARLNVVSLNRPPAGIAVGPRQFDSADSFAENEVAWPARGALLRSRGDVSSGLWPVPDGLCPNGKSVAHLLLQVVNKQHSFVHALLHLFGIIWKKKWILAQSPFGAINPDQSYLKADARGFWGRISWCDSFQLN